MAALLIALGTWFVLSIPLAVIVGWWLRRISNQAA
jgi:hypothetical protein